MSLDFGVNQGLVEELFLRYCANPTSVTPEWRTFFEGLPAEDLPRLTSPGLVLAPAVEERTLATGAAPEARPTPRLPPAAEEPVSEPALPVDGGGSLTPGEAGTHAVGGLQAGVAALINAHRVRGHLFADLDPLGLATSPPDELSLERFGLGGVPPETVFHTGTFGPDRALPLHEIVHRLRETYCRTIGVEYTFIEAREPRLWLQERMEATQNRLELSAAEEREILTKLTAAEVFEEFLHTNFVGAKRFSLEGAESLIPLLELVLERAADLGVDEVVLGMAHRGRLNVLANIMGQSAREIFAEFQDKTPEHYVGRGDVKYHLGWSSDRTTASGRPLHVTLTFNPSHLEYVNPVVEGRVRAKQDRRGDLERRRVLPLLIHGDAAFAGQGVVAETLNLAGLEHYRTGGTLHVVVNNQIGFTTPPADGRSTRHATDITRMLRCPVFHVNGEDPEAVAQVAALATEYRQRFQSDVVIDLFCYRKHGHNEGDEPRYTQPLMYAAIDRQRPVREVYVDRLTARGRLSRDDAEEIRAATVERLEEALREAGAQRIVPGQAPLRGVWQGYRGGPDAETPDVPTAVPRPNLHALARAVRALPPGLRAHRKVDRLLEARLKAVVEDEPIDWATAEALALASLVAEGHRVRLTGQDVRRGTFSQRHAVVFDTATGRPHNTLASAARGGGTIEVVDSPLSEAGVLGFEYGYSLDSPDALVVWEAQFGDFANCAQVCIDQFLSAGEDKWHRLSGLTLLLPHGFEGQGPEHSSARIERFLALAAEDNLQICNLTTPAQLFHCLRRQMLRPWRKPLVVFTPKSLLRHPLARSALAELDAGGFRAVLGDREVQADAVRRILVCSGKVYYDLVKARETRDRGDVALVRLEQLYPLRRAELHAALAPFAPGTDLVWVQEEPWNMGPWFSLSARLLPVLAGRFPLRAVTRPESASPATGSHAAHALEVEELVARAFAPGGPA